MAKKRPGARLSKQHRHTQKGAGLNSTKTRPDVPSTPANKAATGKQIPSRLRARKG